MSLKQAFRSPAAAACVLLIPIGTIILLILVLIIVDGLSADNPFEVGLFGVMLISFTLTALAITN